MAEASAFQIADFFLRFSHDHGDPISNLKLQKLLYYAQAWYLALYDRLLFDERIEAWVHGPAVPPVYGLYKGWAWRPIEAHPDYPEIAEPVADHLREVIDAYGHLDAYELEKLTHSELPWIKARAGLPPDASSNAVISPDDMKSFYRTRMVDG